MPKDEIGHDTNELKQVAECAAERAIDDGRRSNGGKLAQNLWNLVNGLSMVLLGVIGYLWNSLNTDFKEHLRMANELRDNVTQSISRSTTRLDNLEKEGVGLRLEIRDIVARIEKQLEKLDEKISKLK